MERHTTVVIDDPALRAPVAATVEDLELGPVVERAVATHAASVPDDEDASRDDGVVVASTDDEDLVSIVADLRARGPGDVGVAVVGRDASVADDGRSVEADDGRSVEAALLDAGASAVVRADGAADDWTTVLEHRLRSVAATASSAAGTSQGGATVHALASTFDDLDSERAVCAATVDAVGDLVAYDACVLAEATDDEFVPLAATASDPRPGRDRLDVTDGVAGETHRTGRPVRVDDLAAGGRAAPDLPYRSVLSVPVGDAGVLQVAATDPGAYDDRDRDRLEHLAGAVGAALARVRYERQLTRERDRATALFQNIPDAAVEYVLEDGVPRIERVNSAFVNVFGHEPADAVGETTLDLLVPEAAVEDALGTYDGLRSGTLTDREVTRTAADGPAPFLLRDVPIAGDDDTHTGYLIYTDISELVERERELERQNERLDTFASMVSHDLRNPLTTAQGYTDLALETEDLSHLAVVQEEHERMFDMIADLLALARQGDAIGDVEPTALDAVVDAAWATVETNDATLDARSLPVLAADPDRVQQALENLFRNSVEHGGDDVTVTVGALADDHGFYVADDGPGIPEADREAVLEAGMTTAADSGGTGLGLAIVTEVADGHDWTLDLTESATGGARFEFRVDDADVLDDAAGLDGGDGS